jgi:hypothetical protein
MTTKDTLLVRVAELLAQMEHLRLEDRNRITGLLLAYLTQTEIAVRDAGE